jgi:ABC-type multidrug transport system fused ATPase/permease subunit
VRISGIAIYMLVRSPFLGLCAVSIVPLVAFVNKLYGDWLGKNAKAVQDALAQANASAQETLSCIRTVIAFASENFEHKKYCEKIETQYKLNILQVIMQFSIERLLPHEVVTHGSNESVSLFASFRDVH